MKDIELHERALTGADLACLRGLAAAGTPLPPELAEALDAHDLVPPGAPPADLVTLWSEVDLHDPATARRQRVKLCEPAASNPALGFISVLSPLGAALLGLRAGMVARWALPLGGEREALIERVTFQPVAAHAAHSADAAHAAHAAHAA
ncbi:MAG: GreA/GreB family elongation factor [Rubrivivax sp.]|nr:GreA/GreB family elongation factor [Rubrivivax sp.]MCL4698226.1 GreA/GreB family elongation factor [Burkholderiaceae bacterium]